MSQCGEGDPPICISFKKITKKGNLDCIVDNNGNAFNSPSDCNKFIEQFYMGLYRQDHEVQGDIDTFLGPTISRHPIVLESKLADAERRAG